MAVPKLYFSQSTSPDYYIQRANTDGTSLETVVADDGTISPKRMVVDTGTNILYYGDSAGPSGAGIYKVSLDGGFPATPTRILAYDYVGGLALDQANGHLYYNRDNAAAAVKDYNLYRCNTDGSGSTTVIPDDGVWNSSDLWFDNTGGTLFLHDKVSGIRKIAVSILPSTTASLTAVHSLTDNNKDITLSGFSGKLYYNDLNTFAVSRVNFDGSGNEVVIADDGTWGPKAVYVDEASSTLFVVDSVSTSIRKIAVSALPSGTAGAAALTQVLTQSPVDLLVHNLNDPPVITNLNGESFTFTEGDAATLIDVGSDATVTDSNSTDFIGGALTVTIAAGEDAAEDTLSLDTSGTVSMAGATAGSNVSVGGSVVGTLGNSIAAGNDLVVNFTTANATPANAQTLVRAITYWNSDTAAPTTGARTVRTTISDGDGGTGTNADVTVSVAAINDPPTLTSFASVIDTTNEDTEVELTLAELSAQGDEADVDGSVTAFVVQAVSSGILKIGTSAGTATAYAGGTNDTIHSTNNAYWIPAGNANGTLNAFTVKAKDDGGDLSSTAVQASVLVTAVNDVPTLTAFAAPLDTTDEDTEVEITLAEIQAQGDESDVEDVTVSKFVIKAVSGGTLRIGATSGTATAWVAGANDTVDASNHAYWTPAANANGTLNAFTVVAEDSANAESTPAVQAQVSVTAVNDAPTLTSFGGPLTSTDEDVEAVITKANLDVQGNEADVDGTVDAYVVQAVSTGTLKIGATAGTASAYVPSTNDTIDATNNAYWTPAADANGILNAFTVKAKDNGGALSATAVQTQVSVTPIADTPSVTNATTNEDTQSTSGLVITRNANDGGEVTHFKITGISGGTLYKAPSDGGAPIAEDSFITVSEGGNGLRFTPTANSTVDGIFFVQAGTDGVGGGLSTGSAQATITVTPVNDAPTIANLNGDAVSFNIGGSAVVLDNGSNATLADIDSTDFNGGNVTVAITANRVDSEDQLLIGTVGAIGTSAGDVTHTDGVTIGTFTGGTGTNNLVVTLNANATVARVQELLRAIQYNDSNASTISTNPRTVRITVNDGDGATSANQDVTVNLLRAPILDLDADNSSGNITGGYNGAYVEGTAAGTTDTDATISDDGTGYKSLTVTLTTRPNGAAESLASTIGTGQQTLGADVVNIIAYNSGTGVLQINVDAADGDGVISGGNAVTLMESIQYNNTSNDPDPSSRNITFSATDNDDNVGANVTATLSVTGVNDAPTLTSTNASPTFTEGGAAVSLYSGTAVGTIEAGQSIVAITLTVTNVGDGAAETLGVDGTDVAMTNGNSGTTGANSYGYSVTVAGSTATLSISGSLSAGQAQTLVDSLAYKNSSDAPTTAANRVVTLTSVKDSGSTANGGVDTTALAIASTVTVAEVNDAPTITGQATLTTESDTALTVTLGDLTVSDPDNSYPTGFTLSLQVGTNYSLSLPGNIVIPAPGYVGDLTVPAIVNDGTDDSTVFNLLVTVTLGNTAPTISGTPDTTVAGHTPYSFIPTAHDADGDPLTFIIIGEPSWASFNTVTGELSGTPTNSDIGTTTGILIKVNDGTIITPLTPFDLTVTENPDIDGDGMPNDWETSNGLDPQDPSDAVLDKDGDGLTNLEEYQASKDPASDDNPPVVTPPADVTVDAVGLFTPVDVGSGSAVDALDGPVSATSDAPSHFSPGTHTVTWYATDAAGNSATATQTVNVNPLISFGKPQIAAEGSTVSFSLFLNGPAATYPVTVPYTVSGTAATDGSDHSLLNGTLTILSGTEAVISFTTVDDGAGEGTEQIVITMGAPTNAAAGTVTVHTIDIVEGNVAPMVALRAEQGTVPTTTVVVGDGQVSVHSVVTDSNPADVHSYDWSGSDNALIDTDGNADTFTFDPSALSPGVYTLRLSVSDGSVSDDAVLSLNVVAAAPALSAANDSDGDGSDDVTEGYGDADGDGIADYMDSIDSRNLLQELSGQSDRFLIEVEPGLQVRLGDTAFKAGLGQASITMSDVTTYGGIMADSDYSYGGGLLDFSVEHLPVAGQRVRIVLPQQAAIPAGASYRTVVGGMWQEFVVDADNIVASAPGEAGYCPPPGDSAYSAGLTEGDWCVQLTIQDGGPNDGDGLANHRVVDPAGIATALAQPVTVKVSSGGGAASPWLLILLGLLLWRMKILRREDV